MLKKEEERKKLLRFVFSLNCQFCFVPRFARLILFISEDCINNIGSREVWGGGGGGEEESLSQLIDKGYSVSGIRDVTHTLLMSILLYELLPLNRYRSAYYCSRFLGANSGSGVREVTHALLMSVLLHELLPFDRFPSAYYSSTLSLLLSVSALPPLIDPYFSPHPFSF